MFAQDMQYQDLFAKSLKFVNERKGKEVFKGQIISGERKGMGILSAEDGSAYYIGDFYNDDISGYGMYIAVNDFVKNCENCCVYVGNWKKGKKEGFGRCYNHDGTIIYQGQFANDKPVGTYPSDGIKTSKVFSVRSDDDTNSYIGEIVDGIPEGLGLFLFANGDMWLSSFKEGREKGIGLFLQYDGEWQTINIKDGNREIVSSSENYRAITAERKLIRDASLNNQGNIVSEQQEGTTTVMEKVLAGLAMFAQQTSEMLATGTSAGNSNNVSYTGPAGNNEMESSSSESSGSSLKLQYQNWERRAKSAYNSLVNTGIRVTKNGKNVGGTNGQSLNGGNYVRQKQLLREAQNEMKNIRVKAGKKGINIPQSEYETVIVKY